MARGSFSPTIGQIRALESIAAAGSFEHASRTVTRSTTFTALTGLEGHINRLPSDLPPVQLTVPGTGRLSAEGQALLAPAVEVVSAFEAFQRTCERLRSGQSHLSIGCFPAHADRVAVAMRTVADDGVSFQLVVAETSRAHRGSDMVNAVARHELDLAIAPDCVLPEGLRSQPLYRWQLRCVVGEDHQFVGRETCELSELKDQRVLASPRGHVTRSLIDATNAVGIEFDTDSADALLALGMTGWGVALVPDDCAPFRSSPEFVRSRWPVVWHRGQPLSGTFNVVVRTDMVQHAQFGQVIGQLCSVFEGHGHSPSSGPIDERQRATEPRDLSGPAVTTYRADESRGSL